jgi:bifunctional DNA-binding transcriptional regulator/antitoxin component of YhaV-PrlF toxin-antitoxin module
MSTTITLGKAGLLIVPKAIRDIVGLHEGARLRIEAMGGKFEATIEPEEAKIKMRGGFPVIVGGRPREKNGIVRAIKAEREERDDRLASTSRRRK